MKREMQKQISLRSISSTSKQSQHDRWTSVSQDTTLLPKLCSSKDNGSFKANVIGCKIKVWWPIYKILYDNGDVEVLQLDKERSELLDNGRKAGLPLSNDGGFRSNMIFYTICSSQIRQRLLILKNRKFYLHVEFPIYSYNG